MTILHDNLYTKRAVATLPGRNRYLSRAMSVKWVLSWPKEKHPQKRHGMTNNNPNSITYSVGPLEILGRLNNRLLWKPRPPRNWMGTRLLHPINRLRGLQKAPQVAHLRVPPVAHLLVLHPNHPPVLPVGPLLPALRPNHPGVHPPVLPAPCHQPRPKRNQHPWRKNQGQKRNQHP